MASFSLHDKWPTILKSGANLASGTVQGCIHMPLRKHSNGSNTLYLFKMDVGSSQKWISASNMMLWHHSHSTATQNSQIWGQLGRWNGIWVHPYALETAFQWLKHFVYLIWMYEVVYWGGYQPQPRCYGIIPTQQATQNSQILGQLGPWNVIRVHPYGLETAYSWLKHFVYI